jgi:membrane protein DedA with SNARE-associated domain
MDLAQILETLRQHGDVAYSFVFAYAASNSLLVVLFAGYAAHMGAFDWKTLILVCWGGSIFGDAVRFWIGRRFGTRWLKSWPRLERTVLVTARLVDRHYVLFLLFHRYPNGIRNIAGFACGMSRLPASTFLAINFVTGGIWAVLVVSIGYGFGHVSEKVVSDAASGIGLALLALFLGISWLLSKKLERAVERT